MAGYIEVSLSAAMTLESGLFYYSPCNRNISNVSKMKDTKRLLKFIEIQGYIILSVTFD
jgi:hypothetical protein